jgi:catechol 2,3-dioxygenase-like lactoylglutathione lyase family enzyme
MRIRQIALVARDLEPVVADLTAVLGIEVAFRDPGVAQFGLHNAVMPVGETFLEVVSPVREGTTAGRLLDKRGGDGGYMVILQTEDLRADRARLAALGMRIVWEVELDDIATVHLHPRDIGGAIVSLDRPVPPASWRWGGPEWQAKVRTDVVRGIASVTIQADDPPRMAARWAEVLGLPAPRRLDRAVTLPLSPGAIHFVPITDGRGEGVAAFGVTATDAGRAVAAARARGLATSGRSVSIGGVRVELE